MQQHCESCSKLYGQLIGGPLWCGRTCGSAQVGGGESLGRVAEWKAREESMSVEGIYTSTVQ